MSYMPNILAKKLELIIQDWVRMWSNGNPTATACWVRNQHMYFEKNLASSEKAEYFFVCYEIFQVSKKVGKI